MDRYSRAIAALGVDTMQNMMSLKVLVIGLTGVGIETAKDLILAGPQAVTVHDDDTAQLADLGTNFYLKTSHVGLSFSYLLSLIFCPFPQNPRLNVALLVLLHCQS